MQSHPSRPVADRRHAAVHGRISDDARPARHSEYRDTPILVLSGLEEPEWPARAIEAGATGFILKSNNWNELVERIGRYLP
ncbi:MAG: hypothetical protein M5R42_04215 [Rhodocyclaceae bacterium]|nr:hypothetical protein [Rhodocyclaceae bacterium]